MEELEYGTFAALCLGKQLSETDKGKTLLRQYANYELGDYFPDMAWDAIGTIFEDCRMYYNEELEADIFVFFDPLIDEFYSLCRRYELKKQLSPSQNKHRDVLTQAVWSSFSMDSYDYDVRLFNDSHGRARLVFLNGPEFGGLYDVPSSLIDARECFTWHCEKLKQELSEPHIDAEKEAA